MKSSMYAGIVSVLLGFSSIAMGDRDQGQGQGQGRGQVGVPALRFEEIKIACQDPVRYHNQTAPTNISVACKDVQLRWVPDTSGTVQLSSGRWITTSLISDKYTVNPETSQLKMSNQIEACPHFKRISETVVFEKNVTCEEIVQYPGTGVDFCLGITNDLKSANPQAVELKETGEFVSLCDQVKIQSKSECQSQGTCRN